MILSKGKIRQLGRRNTRP